MERDVIKKAMQGWREETPDNIKQATRETMRHLPKRRNNIKKAWITIAACACVAVVLFVTPVGSYALAAIQNVFGLFAQQRYDNEGQKNIMSELEQNAQHPEQQEVKRKGDEQAVSANVDGIFYDGEQLVVSYKIQGKKSFDTTYQPTKEELAQMHVMDKNNNTALEPSIGKNDDMDAVNKKIEEGQPVGWRSYDVYINDSIYTKDGLDVPPATDSYFWNGEEKVGIRFFNLTEELKKRDKLTLDIGFTVYETCYYFDGSKEYFSSKKCESQTVEVSTNKQKSIKVHGSGEFEAYKAEAYMTISPAFISAKVKLTPLGDESTQKAWLEHYKTETEFDFENVPWVYNVLDDQGKIIAKDVTISSNATDTQAEIDIRFAAIKDLPGHLILRPTYMNEDQESNEDIIINLP